jgi:arylsulfatase A-like enzyme
MNERLPDIILITIDSLRRDHLECYGYSLPTSPTMKELSKQGSVFSEMISNGGGTPEAFPSIIASSIRTDKLSTMKYCKSIAQVLKQHGYSTAAFHSNPYISHFYYYNKGFDIFEDNIDSHSERFTTIKDAISVIRAKPPIVRAKDLTEKAIKWLTNSQDQSRFLWIHFMDAHTPYIPPKEYVKEFGGKEFSRFEIASLYRKVHYSNGTANPIPEVDVAKLVALYDSAIRYVDDSIKRILDCIKTDNYILVLTADHGEEFGEHNAFGHPGMLYEDLIHVPFIVYSALQRPIPDPGLVGSIDISPSLLSLAGLPQEPLFGGVSFIENDTNKGPTWTGVVSWADRPARKSTVFSYRTKRWKLISTGLENNSESELYDLNADEHETHNLAHENPKLVEALDAEIPNWINGHNRSRSEITRRIRFIKQGLQPAEGQR